MFIPEISDQIRLVRPWAFCLNFESRNEALLLKLVLEQLKLEDKGTYWMRSPHYRDDKQVAGTLIDNSIVAEHVHECGYVCPGDPGRTLGDRCPSCKKVIKSLAHRNPPGRERVLNKAELGPALIDLGGKGWGMRCDLPTDTVLSIDRIYIRKGSSDFSSVTFFLKSTSHPLFDRRQKKLGKKPLRFWARLEDVNCIEFEQELGL